MAENEKYKKSIARWPYQKYMESVILISKWHLSYDIQDQEKAACFHDGYYILHLQIYKML